MGPARRWHNLVAAASSCKIPIEKKDSIMHGVKIAEVKHKNSVTFDRQTHSEKKQSSVQKKLLY